jgi:CRISPR-associated protein Csm3
VKKDVAPRTKIDLQFLISMSGTMAIGSGFPRGQVDRSVVQGLNGLPYIPASTLKGRVRDMAERLLKTLGHAKICNGPLPDFMCPANGRAETPCLICKTFGTTGLSSVSGQTGLIWRDAPACDENEKELSARSMHEANDYFYARTQVQLSRPRGVALAKHLFTVENTIENLLYKGRVRGWLPRTKEKFSDELLLLCAGLKLLCFLGGSKSRGAGQCSVKLHKNIVIDDQEIPPTEIFQEIERLDRRRG